MSKTLKVLTSIYALLYTALIVSAIFDEGFRKQGIDTLGVFIPFVIFLVGYVVVWKNEIYGGSVFILWWIAMWYVGFVLSETDRGVAVVMGFPLFILAILHVISGYKNRKATHDRVEED
jgi:hypothetical protein